MSALGTHKALALFALISLFAQSVKGLRCYQCTSTNSTKPFECNEFMSDDSGLEPESCDHIYNAQYCIKTVGRFEVVSLNCYQCTSAEEWKCADGQLLTESLVPKSCDHVFEAQYCVKTVGRYGGGIGTKRMCSPDHLGNYCDFVKQPGDKLTYRTCVYTCTGDGCNPASTFSQNKFLILLPIILLRIVGFFRLYER